MFLEKNYCSEGKMFKIENAMKTSELMKRRKLDKKFSQDNARGAFLPHVFVIVVI